MPLLRIAALFAAANLGLIAATALAAPPGNAPPGMVWIEGGEFAMGSRHPLSRPDERPIHSVRVDDFWIDTTEVTNAQFREFVEATGYQTIAERAPKLEEVLAQLPPGTPPPKEEALVAASVVFTPTDGPVSLRNPAAWWRWQAGADWRHPEGPDSDLAGRDDHPVVHVAWLDAMAYAQWAGKQLPTEAQWEYAARGGRDGAAFTWGDAPLSAEAPQCNIWQGDFPHRNTAADGHAGTAPVRSYPPNGYGLHDMAGNVWEWTADWFRRDAYARRVRRLGEGVVANNPPGPNKSFDPTQPYTPLRTVRGGSFLCNDSYCASYRPAARMGCSPDTGLSHTGFRCVKIVESP